jgi:mono/diheme cytochrome c family protein
MTFRRKLPRFLNVALFCAAFAACTKDMAIQERLQVQNHVMQPPVAGAVANLSLNSSGGPSQKIEEAVKNAATNSATRTANLEYLTQGREKFDIHCSPCHDRAASGNGVIVSRGFKKPPPLFIEGVSAIPDAGLFSIISEGFGSMPAFRNLISEGDRRAIIAYIRVLQLSHQMPADFLEPEDQQALSREGGK